LGLAYVLVDQDRAIDWFAKGYEERSFWMTNLGGPAWRRLRDTNPRFAALVKKVGLPQRPTVGSTDEATEIPDQWVARDR
jgi:hypothetical protein